MWVMLLQHDPFLFFWAAMVATVQSVAEPSRDWKTRIQCQKKTIHLALVVKVQIKVN